MVEFGQPFAVRFSTSPGAWLSSKKRVGRNGSEHLASLSKEASLAGVCTFHAEDGSDVPGALYSGCCVSIRALTSSKTTGRFLRIDGKVAKYDLHRDQVRAKVARLDDDEGFLEGHCFEIFRIVDGEIDDSDDAAVIAAGDPIAIRVEGTSFFMSLKRDALSFKAPWSAAKCTLTLHAVDGALRDTLLSDIAPSPTRASLCFEYQKNFGEHAVGKSGWQVPKQSGIFHFADAASTKDLGEIPLNGGLIGEWEVLLDAELASGPRPSGAAWPSDADGWVYAQSWQQLIQCEHASAPARRGSESATRDDEPLFRRRAIVRAEFRRRADDNAAISGALADALAQAVVRGGESAAALPARGGVLGAIKRRVESRPVLNAIKRGVGARLSQRGGGGDGAAGGQVLASATAPTEQLAADALASKRSSATVGRSIVAANTDSAAEPPPAGDSTRAAAAAGAHEGELLLAQWAHARATKHEYEGVHIWSSLDALSSASLPRWSEPVSRTAEITIERDNGNARLLASCSKSSRAWTVALNDATQVSIDWWDSSRDGSGLEEDEAVSDGGGADAPLLAAAAGGADTPLSASRAAPPHGAPWRRIVVSDSQRRLYIAPSDVSRTHPAQIEADEALSEGERLTGGWGARHSWEQPNDFEDCWRAVVQGVSGAAGAGSTSSGAPPREEYSEAIASYAHNVRADVLRVLERSAGGSTQLLALDATAQQRLASEEQLATMVPALVVSVRDTEEMLQRIEAGEYATKIRVAVDGATDAMDEAKAAQLTKLAAGRDLLRSGFENLTGIIDKVARVREMQAALTRVYVQPFVPTGRAYAGGASFETEEERVQREQDGEHLKVKLNESIAGFGDKLRLSGVTGGGVVGGAVKAVTVASSAKDGIDGTLNALAGSIEGAAARTAERGAAFSQTLASRAKSAFQSATDDEKAKLLRERDDEFNAAVDAQVAIYIESQRERLPTLVAEERCWERAHPYLFWTLAVMCVVDTLLAFLVGLFVYLAK